MRFRVVFEQGRIGRRYGIEPQEFDVDDSRALPTAMYSFVRAHLLSQGIEITTYDDGTGDIRVGLVRVVGRFRWERVPA